MITPPQRICLHDKTTIEGYLRGNVCSEPYRVAALGNVATHTAHRGKGFAKAAVAALCHNLRRTVDHVGLNVAADNTAAVRCYQRLGFQIIATYEECHVQSRDR